MPKTKTPWGIADSEAKLAEGIVSYSTPSHGGIWIAKDRVNKIPSKAKNFLGNKQWWEEDCDWAVPYVVFAEDIKAHGTAYHFEDNLKAAKETLKYYQPELHTILCPE